ncbi:MAG: sugar transferase [Coriobacteriia bacterium]
MLDLAVALIALVVLLPLGALLVCLVTVSMGPPAIFVQERAGLGGRIFRLYKFRTMTDDRDASGTPLPDGQRLTRIGAFLRRTSLDELPQFFNVLRGDMSLVGPRPLLPEYLPLYTERQGRRHDVRPGITGLAQVTGRNALSWEDRLELDARYVDEHSLLGDLKILVGTVAVVFRRDNVSHAGSSTMPKFEGTRTKDCGTTCDSR